MTDEDRACAFYKRPVRIMHLDKRAAPLVKPYVGYDEVQDLSWLYALNFEWVADRLALSPRAGHD